MTVAIILEAHDEAVSLEAQFGSSDPRTRAAWDNYHEVLFAPTESSSTPDYWGRYCDDNPFAPECKIYDC